MQDVAKFYGLQMNHSGMACCPFHDDRTPSLKVYDDHFYCFGCGATGDCTGFTAKLFGIPQIEAAKKISYDFGLNLFNGEIAVPVNPRLKSDNDFHVWLRNANLVVSEYLSKLNEWRKSMLPKISGNSFTRCLLRTLKEPTMLSILQICWLMVLIRKRSCTIKRTAMTSRKYRNALKSSPLRFVL